jgi:hypothetical protein
MSSGDDGGIQAQSQISDNLINKASLHPPSPFSHLLLSLSLSTVYPDHHYHNTLQHHHQHATSLHPLLLLSGTKLFS